MDEHIFTKDWRRINRFLLFSAQLATSENEKRYAVKSRPIRLNEKWTVIFDNKFGGPEQPVVFDSLVPWTGSADAQIKYYSGTAIYHNSFNWTGKSAGESATIEFDSLYNIATIKVNGTDCGTLWTRPYKLDITKALINGINHIEIEVSNTWHNRLIGDQLLPVEKKITWTTAPFRLANKAIVASGIDGRYIAVRRVQ
jgi:hypothetical protein